MKKTPDVPSRCLTFHLFFLAISMILATGCSSDGVVAKATGDQLSDRHGETIRAEVPENEPVATSESSETVAIIDNQVEPQQKAPEGASGYSNSDERYFGNPIWAKGIANIPIRNRIKVSQRFAAAKQGSIRSVSFIIKYDHKKDGYNSGNCGDLKVAVHPDNRSGEPATEELASVTYTEPCFGERDLGWLTNAELNFPVEVEKGKIYHLVFSNTDPDPENWVSINVLNRAGEDSLQAAITSGNGIFSLLAKGDQYWSGNDLNEWGQGEVLSQYYPVFEVHYEDGFSQGVSYVGAREENEITLAPGGDVRVRQAFIPDQNRLVERVWLRGESAGVGSLVKVRLYDGTNNELLTEQLARASGESWFSSRLFKDLTLVEGTQYYAEIECLEGWVKFRPLYQASHDDWRSTGQSDWKASDIQINKGGMWVPYMSTIDHDLSFYFDTVL